MDNVNVTSGNISWPMAKIVSRLDTSLNQNAVTLRAARLISAVRASVPTMQRRAEALDSEAPSRSGT